MRPLSQRMIMKLQECRQMEASNTNTLCPPEHFNSSLSGLCKRGLVGLKKYTLNDKELMGVYVTHAGNKLLDDLKKMDEL